MYNKPKYDRPDYNNTDKQEIIDDSSVIPCMSVELTACSDKKADCVHVDEYIGFNAPKTYNSDDDAFFNSYNEDKEESCSEYVETGVVDTKISMDYNYINQLL